MLTEKDIFESVRESLSECNTTEDVKEDKQKSVKEEEEKEEYLKEEEEDREEVMTAINSKIIADYSSILNENERIVQDLKEEVKLSYESNQLLNKYIEAASHSSQRFFHLEKSDSQYAASAAADATASHLEAEQKAIEYARTANKLVKKYELARLAALELVSSSLCLAEEHRIAAEKMKILDSSYKNRSIKEVSVKQENKKKEKCGFGLFACKSLRFI